MSPPRIAWSGDEGPFLGGWHLQALAEPIVEATLAVATSVWLVEWARRHWDGDGWLLRALGRASFGAYVVHPPVVVLLSAALRSVTVVAELKFLVVAVLGVVVSFALGTVPSLVGRARAGRTADAQDGDGSDAPPRCRSRRELHDVSS